MAYTKWFSDWKDANSATGGGNETTPLDQAALDHIETGISDAHTDLATHLADASDAHDASAISISDSAGDFTATDVEGALAEIQTDVEAMSATAATNLKKWQIVFRVTANEPPAASFATLDTRNNRAVLDFDAAAIEVSYFVGVLPSSYAGGGVNVKLIWAATSATSGNVAWNTAFERIPASGLDLDSDSAAAANAAVVATDAVSGETTETTIAHSSGSQMDSLAAGELFRLQVSRSASDGSDTMTGDAELVAVIVTEQ